MLYIDIYSYIRSIFGSVLILLFWIKKYKLFGHIKVRSSFNFKYSFSVRFWFVDKIPRPSDIILPDTSTSGLFSPADVMDRNNLYY